MINKWYRNHFKTVNHKIFPKKLLIKMKLIFQKVHAHKIMSKQKTI